MNKTLFRKILPHLLAFLVFLIVSIIYCRPVLEGKVVQQSDITQWQGAVHQSQVYKEQHGHLPLWTNSMFSGMPAFQIAVDSDNVIPGYIHKVLTLGLPVPAQFFFLASICFYFLCMVLRINPYVGILGALGFAYATYNPVIIVAGHSTKMWTMAYMPAVLGSLILIYEKKYWAGAALTALFTAVMVSMNHPQIVYYFFLTAAIMTVFYVVRWIKQKDWKHFGYAFALTAVAGLTGLLVNADNLLGTYEYQKETIRGGASALTDTTANQETKSQTGLDKSYAFSYSMGIAEPFVMMVPRMYGGSDGYPSAIGGQGYREMNEDDSKTVQALQSLPQELIQQLARSSSLYWGGVGSTSGPPYVGAIICFLAILALFLPQNKHRWWALTAIIVTIMMSWGSYFKEFNYLLYDYFPFYNKFRAPSMLLVIPQLLLPMLAVIAVDIYTKTTDKKILLPYFKKGAIATGAVFLVLFMIYFTSSFLSPEDEGILKQVRQAGQPQLTEAVNPFFDALKEDRKGLMIGDIFRSLGFIALAAAILFFLLRNALKPLTATILLTVFAFIDVIIIDSKYLNADGYLDDIQHESSFQPTKADQEILADKSYYRVFNVNPDRFAEAFTSYHYNSLGGYHAVKLRIYQDLIERQIGNGNPAVLNMLNAKYLIQKDGQGQTTQYQKNDGALGPAWFVQHIQFVKNADEEMNSLDHFNPKDTAFVQESFRSSIPFLPQPDSTATITLVKNENDLITYSSESASNQFAVFSEIYYSRGWTATIDGKPAPIVKTDYALRGLAVPAGKHTIEFRFAPKGYKKGVMLTHVFTIALLVLIAIAVFMEIRNRKKPRS